MKILSLTFFFLNFSLLLFFVPSSLHLFTAFRQACKALKQEGGRGAGNNVEAGVSGGQIITEVDTMMNDVIRHLGVEMNS